MGEGKERERRGETYHIVLVVFVHLRNIGVDERLRVPPLDDELRRSVAQLARGEEHVLDEAEDAILLDLLGRGEGLLQLLLDGVRGVEDVDLGVRVAGAHLAALQAGHHGVHEVGALLVADLGQDVLCEGEDLALVHAAELHVHAEVLLVEGLHERVEESAQRCVLGLLDDFGARLLCVVLARDAGESEHVHHVFRGQLELGAEDELELVDGHVAGFEQRGDHEAVVLGAVFDKLDRRFQVVEEAVDVGKEDLDVAACTKELGDFQDWNELIDIRQRPARRVMIYHMWNNINSNAIGYVRIHSVVVLS